MQLRLGQVAKSARRPDQGEANRPENPCFAADSVGTLQGISSEDRSCFQYISPIPVVNPRWATGRRSLARRLPGWHLRFLTPGERFVIVEADIVRL